MADLDSYKEKKKSLLTALSEFEKEVDPVEKAIKKVLNDKVIAENEVIRIREKNASDLRALADSKVTFEEYRKREMGLISSEKAMLEAEKTVLAKDKAAIQQRNYEIEAKVPELNALKSSAALLKADYESKLAKYNAFLANQG